LTLSPSRVLYSLHKHIEKKDYERGTEVAGQLQQLTEVGEGRAEPNPKPKKKPVLLVSVLSSHLLLFYLSSTSQSNMWQRAGGGVFGGKPVNTANKILPVIGLTEGWGQGGGG
jgi:hypothetical protein